jgi:hypothetical protein
MGSNGNDKVKYSAISLYSLIFRRSLALDRAIQEAVARTKLAIKAPVILLLDRVITSLSVPRYRISLTNGRKLMSFMTFSSLLDPKIAKSTIRRSLIYVVGRPCNDSAITSAVE